MRKTWFAVRSTLLWIASGLHFFFVVPVLVFLSIFLDPRKHDWLQRSLCRRIAFLSGAKVEVRRAPGFDPARTCFFFSNHVNLFDPRSEEHTSELQSPCNLVCRLLLEKKKYYRVLVHSLCLSTTPSYCTALFS